MKRAFLGLIRVYRKHLSALKRQPCCRFYPSCSQYAYEAIEEWGVLRGGLLALYRILRCNPLCKGGQDYVPLRHGAKNRAVGGYTVFYNRSPDSRYCETIRKSNRGGGKRRPKSEK